MKQSVWRGAVGALLWMAALAGGGNARAQELARRERPKFDERQPDVHDPVMARGEDGRFYLFGTGFGLSAMSSADLLTWRQEPPVLRPVPEWAKEAVPGYRGHTWAPDIQRVGDRWLLYYSCSAFGKNTSAIGLATNRTLDPLSPDYAWHDEGMVIQSVPGRDNWNAIDPNLILDRKGRAWLAYGSFWDGIQLVQLRRDMKTPKGKPVTVARRYVPQHIASQLSREERELAAQAPAAGANAIEAPFVVWHEGYYYLFVSWDYCCKGLKSTYKTVVGRSRRVEGPYLDREGRGMQVGGGTVLVAETERYAGVGHCAVCEFDGTWYLLAHGYDKQHNGASKLYLRQLRWDDGWPCVAE